MNAISRRMAPVAIESDGVELGMEKLGGGMTAAFVRVPKGADFRPALSGLPDDLCQCPHWGYLLKRVVSAGPQRRHVAGVFRRARTP